MKLICYAYKNGNNELQAPFLDYLEKYAIHERDSEKKKALKVKQLMNIKAHLDYLIEKGGRHSNPPLTQQYRDRSVGILKISETNNLVRIAFFTRSGATITLLDAIDKPKLYEKGKKVQVDKMIEKFLDRAERYKMDYEVKNLSLPLNP